MYGRHYGHGEQRPDRCPNCSRDTSLARRNRRQVWPDISDNLVLPTGECVFEEVWSCAFCRRTVVELHQYGADHAEGVDDAAEPNEILVVWPGRTPRDLDPSCPAEVTSLYREASIAENAGALRAAGAMYRATVEELCTAQGANGRDLQERINDLVKRGVEQGVVDDLHEARLLGNWSLHEGLEFAGEEVADVADLIQEAVLAIYVQPAQRQAMRNARRQRRTAGP